MEPKSVKDFITIRPSRGKIKVSWAFSIFKKIEEDGRVTCFIPSFDIYYSVDTNDAGIIAEKGRTITRMFVDHFFEHTKSMKNFALEIHKRGFKARNDAYTIKEFIKNNVSSAKFKFEDGDIVDGYTDKVTQKSEIEVSV